MMPICIGAEHGLTMQSEPNVRRVTQVETELHYLQVRIELSDVEWSSSALYLPSNLWHNSTIPDTNPSIQVLHKKIYTEHIWTIFHSSGILWIDPTFNGRVPFFPAGSPRIESAFDCSTIASAV